MIIINIYTSLEDKWYDFVDWLNQYIPVANVVDSIDKVVPSFLIVIALFVLILLGLFGLLFFSGGSGFGGIVSFEAEVTVLSLQGAPVSGAVVSFNQDCSNKGDVSLRTNSEGKVKFSACSDSAYLRISKEGYSTKSEDISFEDNKARIYLSPITSVLRMVNVKVKGNGNIIPEAELYLLCEKEGKLDEILVGDKDQSTVGYLINIPQGCESIQLKAIAEGYNEKKELLGSKEENKTLNLEKINLNGTVVFEVDSNSGRKEAMILVVDELGKQYNLILDSTGVVSKNYSPGEYTYTANLLGSQKSGSFSILTGQTTTVEIFFEEVTTNYVAPILNGTAKGVYLKLIDGNSGVSGAEVRLYYKKDNDFNYYAKRNSSYSGLVEHYPLNDSNNRSYYAIISATNYETKIIDVIYKVSGEEPQEVIMSKGGATLQVEVIDDLNKVIRNAVVSIKKNGFDALFLEPLSTDKNGLVEFKNLPNGVYEIEAKSSTHTGTMNSIQVSADKKVVLKLVTGTGNVKFNLIHEGKSTNAYCELYEKIDDENSLIHQALSTNGYIQAVSIKSEKKVYLVVNDSNFIYTQSPVVEVKRGNQTKELILYKESDLPNSNNVQMFLEGVYNSNPWVNNESKASNLLPGKKYYFLFTLITRASDPSIAVANVFVSPKDSNTIDANTKMYVEDAYSIKNSIVKKSLVMNSSIIEQDLLNTIPFDKAKQLNVYFGEVSGLVAYPILVEASVDLNAIGSTTLFWEGILGEEKSLLYSKEFIIGEKFCFGKGSCPEVLFSNYLRRIDSIDSSKNSEWVPAENYSNLQIGDSYELKVVVENLTDSDFGEIDLVGKVKSTSQTKITLDDDSNKVSSKINLKPFDKNNTVFKLNPIATTPTASIIESIEKGEELKNLKGNNEELKFDIKNKEDIVIQVIASRTPNVIYANYNYPYVYIKTSYKLEKVPVKTIWEVSVKGENNSPIRQGETDVNGEWVGAIDLSSYDEGTTLVFTAIDSNNSNPGYLEITLQKAFNDPITETVPDCISVKINGVNINEINNPLVYSKLGASGGSFTIESSCSDDREVLIQSDLGVSTGSRFPINAGETKTVTINDPSSIVSQRGGMLGAYPMQIMQIINKSKFNQIGFIDVIVSSDSSEFELINPIFDMTKTNSVSSKIINKANTNGERLDIYYPQMNIGTNSVGLTYTKPGVPETIKFNAVVKSHAIEAITHAYNYGSVINQTNRKDNCHSKTKLITPNELIFNDLAQDHTEYITDILMDKIESAAPIETPDADDRDPTKSLYVLPVPIQNKIRSELNATSGSISQTANTSKIIEDNELIYFAEDEEGEEEDEDDYEDDEEGFGGDLEGDPLKPKKGHIYEIIPNMAGGFSNSTCENGIPSVGCGSCSGAVEEEEFDEEFSEDFDEEESGDFVEESIEMELGEGEYSRECKKCEINYRRVSVNPIPPEGFDSEECKLGVVINELDYGGGFEEVEEVEGDLEE
ncbi:MAG: carboxypeptidase-like regulatory domain-containing protein, partial [Candidatus ainarchaeum sp.]|nr:carboxypeptidase-like regulatory domain-containing protein [Candidatus ainarchaeum sp.]